MKKAILTAETFKELVAARDKDRVQIYWPSPDRPPIVQDFQHHEMYFMTERTINELLASGSITPVGFNDGFPIKRFTPTPPTPPNPVFDAVPSFTLVIDLFDIDTYCFDVIRWSAEKSDLIKPGQQVAYHLIDHGYNEEHNTPQLTFECKAFNEGSDFLEYLPKQWHATI